MISPLVTNGLVSVAIVSGGLNVAGEMPSNVAATTSLLFDGLWTIALSSGGLLAYSSLVAFNLSADSAILVTAGDPAGVVADSVVWID